MVQILVFFLLAFSCIAQVVRVANLSPYEFSGWKRTVVDKKPLHDAGVLGNSKYVVSRKIGLETYAVDIFTSLSAFERKTIDLEDYEYLNWTTAGLPQNPIEYFGGIITFGETPLQIVDLRVDGASWFVYVRQRVGRLAVVNAWMNFYPDAPSYIQGECGIVFSNPSVPDMSDSISGTLRFGNSYTYVPGNGYNNPISFQNVFDGQSKFFFFSMIWLDKTKTNQDFSSFYCQKDYGIGAVGVDKLLTDGNPSYPPGYSALAFARPIFGESLRRMLNWDVNLIGPAIRSSDTGSQWDQVFVAGEALLPDGAGVETVYLANALKLHGERPCNHCEADGGQLVLDAHLNPMLAFWDGRPHTNLSANPAGLLGKPRPITEQETRGRYGPDNEHFLINLLRSANRLTGSRASQYLLSNLARVYLLQRTAIPGRSTSAIFSARELCWEGILVDCINQDLEDRVLATRVLERYNQRLTNIIIPWLASKAGDVWDPRQDPRIVAVGYGWQAWQQSAASYGLWLGSRAVGRQDGIAYALRGAKACLEHNWVKLPGESRYRGVVNIKYTHTGKQLSEPYASVPLSDYMAFDYQWSPNWFMTTWDVPAVALVRYLEPNNQKAQAVYAQIMSDIGNGPRNWVPPMPSQF